VQRTTQGFGMCFCLKNHIKPAAGLDFAGEPNYSAAGDLKAAERNGDGMKRKDRRAQRSVWSEMSRNE